MKEYRKINKNQNNADKHIERIVNMGGNVEQKVENGEIVLIYDFKKTNENPLALGITKHEYESQIKLQTSFYFPIHLVLVYEKRTESFNVKAMLKNTEIANANFDYSIDLSGWAGSNIVVNESFRRIGIMSAIYDWVEQETHTRLVPSNFLTEEAELFWESRNKK